MVHKKRIITQLIASIVLVGIAVIIQVFVKPETASFMVAIILGIATGVIVAMVDCMQKNISDLNTNVLALERTICRILSCIRKISTLDAFDDKIVEKVEINLDKIYDYSEEIENLVDVLNMLLIMPTKEKKLQNVLDDLSNVLTFIRCKYNFSSTLKRLDVCDSEFVCKMEALKAVKYMREFDAEPILNYLQHNKNNTMKPKLGDKDCFYNIIFEDDIFDTYNRQLWDDIEKSELEELSKKYKKYDYSKVADRVNQIPICKWEFATGSKKHIDKYLDEEDYYD